MLNQTSTQALFQLPVGASTFGHENKVQSGFKSNKPAVYCAHKPT